MLKRLGNFLVETTDDALGRALLVYAIALLAGIIAFAADATIARFSPRFASELLAVVIGITFGVITFVEVHAVQQRRRKVFEELQIVASLNHNVRNALQSIQYAAHLSAPSENLQIIKDSVRRIDDTLRELFPTIDGEPGAGKRSQS
ncbi:MAG TPA: hypothetical protein VFU86_06800 [Terriglobales bacterium]|nr:hypothetical protein [Terriglobales bacterium]